MKKTNDEKSLSVYLIGFSVIVANLIVLSILYQVPFLSTVPAIAKSLSLISLLAIYPHELFQYYLKNELLIHFYWIMLITVSAFGLLLFNRFSRTIFITFNILQAVILMSVAITHYGSYAFWGYFFKFYFNMVVFMLYVGYLTLPEIREQFLKATKETKIEPWFLKLRRRTLGPKDAIGYFNLGIAYQKLGRIDEALEFLLRAVTIMPDKPEYHFAPGKILFERLEYSKAIKLFLETIELDPIHLQARFYLGQAYQCTGCLEEAVQSFRRCTFLDPLKAELYRHLGIACYHAGYFDEAEQSLRKASELDSEDYLSNYYLALILLKDQHRRKNAEELLKKAVRISVNFTDGYRELGNLYVGSGDYKGAIRAFRDVLKLDPNQTQVHYQLGFSYAMLKDLESARREYKILKEMDPDLAQTLGILLSRS